MNEPHRYLKAGKICPKCDHYHHVPNMNVPGCTGMCLKDPPKVFVIGMAPSAASVIKGDPQSELVPVLRSYYPPVGPMETCGQWTPRIMGEA